MTEELEDDLEDEESEPEHAMCDGCGHQGPDVYSDGFGYNICLVNRCTAYSVRGLSPRDFY